MADTNARSGAPPQTTTPRQIPISTPSRRALSAEPSTSLRRSIRTPGSNRRAAYPPAAATPHGRAALRALDSRRAAIFTPGRRRSLRDVQRETPRDLLRALSRNLAGKTERVQTSSSPVGEKSAVKSEGEFGTGAFVGDDDDEGDERELRVPRMSLPIDEDDDDDDGDWPRPHRSAGLEDENLTVGSVEFGRRAYSEGPRLRSSIPGRPSDIYRLDEDVESEAAIARRVHPIDERGALRLAEEDYLEGGVTPRREFERTDAEAEEARRMSDFPLDVPMYEPGNETTFMLQSDIVGEVGALPESDNGHIQLEDEPLETGNESHVHFADEVVGGEDEQEQEREQGAPELDDEVAEEAEEFTMEVDAATARNAVTAAEARKKKKAGVRLSRYGIQYPSLPPAVVKRLAQTFAKTSGVKGKISPDTLAAIMQASEWFFEQLGDDLQAYAKHAGRKTIDESDVLQLMRRWVTFYTSIRLGISFGAPDSVQG